MSIQPKSFASIIIINFNGARHLRPCLDAISEQTISNHRYEVIVWDNASPDGSADIVAEEYPWVRLIRSEKNYGFAEANNLAAQQSRCKIGDWLILLNPDTVVDPHWLHEMFAEQTRCQASRLTSKLVLSPDGLHVNSGGVVMLRSGWAADDGFRKKDDGRFEESRDVFAGCGAALMIRNDGQPIFPREYFAYYEDVSAGWAALAEGKSTRYTPRALVMHDCGASAGEKSPLFQFLTERNRVLTTLTYADPFLAVWCTVKFTLKSMLGIFRTPQRRAFFSFLRWLPATLIRRYDARSRLTR